MPCLYNKNCGSTHRTKNIAVPLSAHTRNDMERQAALPKSKEWCTFSMFPPHVDLRIRCSVLSEMFMPFKH